MKFDRTSNETDIAKYAKDLTKYLPRNFVTDASLDYTKFIQRGLDENKIVKMPNFPLLINEKGLYIKCSSRIIFQKYSSISIMPNSLKDYGIIRIFNVNNIIIYSPILIGERNKHIGNEGEWGMGIYILGSKNIQILNPTVSDCWGDGIYIGRGDNGTSKNVKIINGVIDNCRRNGISITDGENIEIRNPIISNIHGTMPMCGIDIEPNDNKSTINNIFLINPITFNNSNSGILIYLNALLGQVKKKVHIQIMNHFDNSSDIGFYLGGYNGQNNLAQPLSGSIDIIKPTWKNNRISISSENNFIIGPKVTFRNIKIQNSKGNLQKIKHELSHKKNILVE